MPVGVGVGVGMGAVAAPVAAANTNLLLWSEEVDRAGTWARTLVTAIAANAAAAPDASVTADLVTLDVFGAIRQTSAVAASSGAGDNLGIFDVATEWTRYEIPATIDVGTYVFSVYLKQTEAGIGGRIRLDRSGGFLRCSYEDVGDGGACLAWGAQLEAGATATSYVKREGT
jgi:hypothetical protein